jgi:hypothetical protein
MAKPTGVELATLIIAIIGALAWLPTIISLFLPKSIEGKVISQYANLGKLSSGEDASILVQKMSLFSKNKDFFLKDIQVYIKYPTSQEIKCRVLTWRHLIFTFNENGRAVQKKLRINAQEYLIHNTVLPRDQAVVGYLSFSTDHLKDEKYEYIRYVFIDFKGKRRQLLIYSKDISDDRTIFDDSIWSYWPNQQMQPTAKSVG